MSSISIPKVSYLANNAFQYCQSLNTITFEDNSALTIGSQAFAGCIKLTEVTFKTNNVICSSSAFMNCSKLSKVLFTANTSAIPDLSATNLFSYTPITNSSYLGYYGSI